MTEYEYAENEYPYRCPKCGLAEGIRKDEQSNYDNTMTTEFSCEKCGFEWKETFKFINWEPI